ncbi:unnamed protein product [Lactuca saligna]|uniref:Uncharacterized protein n=1 Tax=Lactuca saligna TaxID=75948 RepID=A0AA35YJC8_LACSI|nr:unnamed protein product [Lactuca saligna]
MKAGCWTGGNGATRIALPPLTHRSHVCLVLYHTQGVKTMETMPANSDSFLIGYSDVGSHDTKVLKDSFSQTGENLTPCARDKSTATSPIKFISTPIELKRNLATCIDIDEMENLSNSKNPRLSPPDEQPTPLLVPKKEK